QEATDKIGLRAVLPCLLKNLRPVRRANDALHKEPLGLLASGLVLQPSQHNGRVHDGAHPRDSRSTSARRSAWSSAAMLELTPANIDRNRCLTAARGISRTPCPSTRATSSLPSSRCSCRRIPAGMTTRPFGPTSTIEVSLMSGQCHLDGEPLSRADRPSIVYARASARH